MGFSLNAFGSAATCARTIQFKRGYAIGDLAVRGIELYIDNLDVCGGSYETGLSKSSKLCTLNEYQWTSFIIDHKPATPTIDFYVNTGGGFPVFGSPTASITTSANIPQAADDAACYICLSISKGAVATECALGLIDFWEIYPD